MRAEKFDRKFDAGEEDIIEDLDLSAIRRPGQELQPLDLEFSLWMVKALDREAGRLDISRNVLIQVWLAERLEQLTDR